MGAWNRSHLEPLSPADLRDDSVGAGNVPGQGVGIPVDHVHDNPPERRIILSREQRGDHRLENGPEAGQLR